MEYDWFILQDLDAISRVNYRGSGSRKAWVTLQLLTWTSHSKESVWKAGKITSFSIRGNNQLCIYIEGYCVWHPQVGMDKLVHPIHCIFFHLDLPHLISCKWPPIHIIMFCLHFTSQQDLKYNGPEWHDKMLDRPIIILTFIQTGSLGPDEKVYL